MNSTPLAEVVGCLRNAKKVALVGHVTPDADCFGVLGAMSLALRQLGVASHVSMPEGSVARKLEFMVELGGWSAASPEQLAACDVALVMDTAKDKRVNIEGKLEALPRATVVNVDHHSSNGLFGKVNWVEGDRSSSCEMIYELARALGCEVTPVMASMLYAGIYSDTQGFSLPNTTARSLEVAHDLALAGADIVDTCERLNRSRSRSEFALLGVIYSNTRLSEDGRLGWSTADHAEIMRTGCTANDIDDQVEVVRSIAGVRLAILFSEGNPGKIRMNFRGERGLPVLALAQQFKGGGHEQAAGAILDGTIRQVVELVVPAAERYLAERLPKG